MAVAVARTLGFDEVKTGELALVVTEAGTNLIAHAGEGEILLRVLRSEGQAGLELLALDRGPGMANVARCLEDGYSTAGTAGRGLGSIARLSTGFQIYSQPGKGTALVAEVWSHPPTLGRGRVGAVCVAKAGEDVSGDAWALYQDEQRCSVLIVDGLGHGQGAADASLEALALFLRTPRSPEELMRALHAGLRSTRGAAASSAEVNWSSGALRYAGVGNCAATIVAPAQARSLPSQNGTLGANTSRIMELSYDFPRESVLVLHTDGVSARWNLDDYPGLVMRHPSLIAGVLYRDSKRERDDATVVVVRERWYEPGGPT